MKIILYNSKNKHTKKNNVFVCGTRGYPGEAADKMENKDRLHASVAFIYSIYNIDHRGERSKVPGKHYMLPWQKTTQLTIQKRTLLTGREQRQTICPYKNKNIYLIKTFKLKKK